MTSVDTNVVIRLVTVDDEIQNRIAQTALEGGIFISAGVLRETEWVLRSAYRWSRERIDITLRQLLELDQVSVDAMEDLFWALDRHRLGADWADMLHLIASRAAGRFFTIDRALSEAAGEEKPVPVIVLS